MAPFASVTIIASVKSSNSFIMNSGSTRCLSSSVSFSMVVTSIAATLSTSRARQSQTLTSNESGALNVVFGREIMVSYSKRGGTYGAAPAPHPSLPFKRKEGFVLRARAAAALPRDRPRPDAQALLRKLGDESDVNHRAGGQLTEHSNADPRLDPPIPIAPNAEDIESRVFLGYLPADVRLDVRRCLPIRQQRERRDGEVEGRKQRRDITQRSANQHPLGKRGRPGEREPRRRAIKVRPAEPPLDRREHLRIRYIPCIANDTAYADVVGDNRVRVHAGDGACESHRATTTHRTHTEVDAAGRRVGRGEERGLYRKREIGRGSRTPQRRPDEHSKRSLHIDPLSAPNARDQHTPKIQVA